MKKEKLKENVSSKPIISLLLTLISKLLNQLKKLLLITYKKLLLWLLKSVQRVKNHNIDSNQIELNNLLKVSWKSFKSKLILNLKKLIRNCWSYKLNVKELRILVLQRHRLKPKLMLKELKVKHRCNLHKKELKLRKSKMRLKYIERLAYKLLSWSIKHFLLHLKLKELKTYHRLNQINLKRLSKLLDLILLLPCHKLELSIKLNY